MKLFNIFDEDVQATTRAGMMHLQKMSDVEFIQFVQNVAQTMQGQLKNLKVSLKVDGAGARFGLDSNRRPFFEGSRTGPIFEPGAFSAHARSKGAAEEVVLRAQHYDKVWEIVTRSEFIKTLPPDTKIICELFYNPMGEVTTDGIKFVSISYNKDKLGQLMTIIPFKAVVASTGEDHPKSERIVADLLSMSNDQIKFIDINLATKGPIDISGMIDPILTMGPETISTLQSRKRDDAQAKADLKQIIQTVKDQVAHFILNHPNILDKFKLGPDIEGLVLNINGRDIKVTTPEFKAAKNAERQERIGLAPPVQEHRFSFIQQELVEARLFPYPDSLHGRSASELGSLLFASILALEIMRHEYPTQAWTYVQKTMAFKDFDKMRSGGTDLANLIAVMSNQDDFSDNFHTNIKVYVPELQTKAYLRSFSSFTPNQVRQFLLRLDMDLLIAEPQLHQARRIVSDWKDADRLHKSTAWSSLEREFTRHGKQIDVYQLAKHHFTFQA
jgi:hypothetical protein